jgi:hypothetical protein
MKRGGGKRTRTTAGKPQARGEERRSQPEYLAVELGHSVDQEGEPTGLDDPASRGDADFQEFTLSLWRQVQSARSSNKREMEDEGLTTGDLWAPGITEFLPTSSTPEELRRYKQKLLFRANVLEVILTETVAELKWLDRARPLDPDEKGG